MRAFSRLSLAVTLALTLSTGLARAVAAEDLEAKVKAAYLFHLAKFVDWPEPERDEMRLCLFGAPAMAGLMQELSNRQVRDRPLKILVDPAAEPEQCQILFVGQDDRRLPDLLRRVRGQAVLTVSDKDGFARQGGIVGFYQDSGKIKLEINPDSARAAKLRVSAKLLGLARTVP